MGTWKSTPVRYGTVAVFIHWLGAALVLVLLVTGFRAADMSDAVAKTQLLRVHIPVAIAVLVLTALRLLWWWRWDRKPPPIAGMSPFKVSAARAVHVALLVVTVAMLASGIGMMILSGAGPAVFASPGAMLPDFQEVLPRRPHGLGARAMVVLLLLHVGAALYHHFVQRDGLLKRMWWGA
jgi:cytochrome b561